MRIRTGTWLLMVALMLGACGGGEDACELTPDLQSRSRFLAGSTIYLGAEPGCGGDWRLESAPEENENELVVESDGAARFTPVVPGTYVFTRGGTKDTFEVIDATAAPFHNLSYYGASTVAAVGDEVWIANVMSPTITRVDPSALRVLGTVPVGQWPVALGYREGMDVVLVAHRGGDSVGFVDVASGRLVDSVWVGDEPANLVVDPTGGTAYVALATQDHIAVVDVATRTLSRELEAIRDVRGMALSPDGATLYAARHRSGQSARPPWGSDSVDDEVDIVGIDVSSGARTTELLEVGTTINALVAAEGRLYVASLQNDTTVSLADPSQLSWVHEVVVYDTATAERVASADLSRQDSSGGYAVALHAMTLEAGSLWVAAEASDAAIELDPETLAERSRTSVSGRPRHLIARDGSLFVHGQQALSLTRISGTAADSVVLEDDPRPATIARGQAYFTGAGDNYGQNWSCNGCHPDGLTDGVVWRAGPVEDFAISRPLFWLDGTAPLGWAAYVSSPQNFAFETTSNIGTRPTTREAADLGNYIRSLMPPPAATQTTTRDGRHSVAGERGKQLFEGKAGCVGCHRLPLGTSKKLFDEGITPGPSDVPSLVGAYRHGVWLKHGNAHSLRAAAVAAADWTEASLSDAELDDLTIYLGELSGRSFFALAVNPGRAEVPQAVDQPVELVFSMPVFAPGIESRIELVDAADNVVPAAVVVDRNRVTVTPTRNLSFASTYTVRLAPELESFSEQAVTGATSFELRTAAEPALSLDGAYTLTVQIPAFNPIVGEFDLGNTLPFSVNLSASPAASGARITLDYGGDLVRELYAIIDGTRLITEPIPIPVNNSFADGFSGLNVELVDADNDGVADALEGTLVVSGPGFVFADSKWKITPGGVCDEGTDGAVAVEIDRSGKVPVISWGEENAIGLYITDPNASLPTGPGTTVGGTAYWVLEAEEFPDGFSGPVSVGTVPDDAIDATGTHGGDAFSGLSDETCYKISVVTSSFKVGSVTVAW